MKSECLIGVEWLRAIAAFGIVGCHLCLSNMTSASLWLGSFTDLNVGVFAMLAGFFFLSSCSKFDSWWKYIRQRGTRLLIPYIFWTVAYICIDIAFDIISGKTLSFQPTQWYYWCNIIFMGGGATHLWFLISLFYVQVFLYLFCKNMNIVANRKMLAFILCIVGFCFVAFCGNFGNWYRFYLLRLTGFFLIGVAISMMTEQFRRISLIVWGGAVLLGVILIGSGWNYGKIGECVLSIPLVLFAICWGPRIEKIKQIGIMLGKVSFGVYLVHVLFAVLFRSVWALFNRPSTATVFLLDQVLVYLSSLIFVWSISRMAMRFPVLKYIFP